MKRIVSGFLSLIVGIVLIVSSFVPVQASPVVCETKTGADCDGWWVNEIAGPSGYTMTSPSSLPMTGAWQVGDTSHVWDSTWTKLVKAAYVDHSKDFLICPIVPFSASQKVCESGYKLGDDGLCHKKDKPSVEPTIETFGPIDVVYGIKSSDPNHCHRPTGSSLGVPNWAMDDFNKLKELKDGTIDHSGDVTVPAVYDTKHVGDTIRRPNCPTETPTEPPTETPTETTTVTEPPTETPTETTTVTVTETITETITETVTETPTETVTETVTETPTETTTVTVTETKTETPTITETVTSTPKPHKTPTIIPGGQETGVGDWLSMRLLGGLLLTGLGLVLLGWKLFGK